MTVDQGREIKAGPRQIRSLDRFRRAQRVTLDALAQRFPRGKSWLSRALAGYVPLSRADVRELRAIITDLSGQPMSAHRPRPEGD